MALSQLDFNLIGPVPFASGGVNAGRNMGQQEVLATFIELAKSSSYWTVANLDITNNDYNAFVLRPNSAPSNIDMRVLVSMGITDNSLHGNPSQGGSETADAESLVAGLCPTSASYTKNGGFNTDIPFGEDARWTKYWSIGNFDSTTNKPQYAFIIESQETILLGSAPILNNIHAGHIGAIATSFDSSSGEQDRRLYGITTTGDSSIGTSFNGGNANFLGHATSGRGTHSGIFIVSGGIANGPIGSNGNIDNIFEHMIKYNVAGSTSITAPSNNSVGSYKRSEGIEVFFPYFYHSNFSSDRAIGMMRQVYACNSEFTNLTTLITGSEGDFGIVGIVVGNDFLDSNHCCVFCNYMTNP